MVWVRPGEFPAKVIVAPNSPSARAQQSTAPATSEGPISGRVTRRNAVSRDAPSVAAASSNPRSRPRNAPSTVTMRNGIATKASATMTPWVVNGSVMPNHWSRYCPTTPSRPYASSSATPPTTGGRTRGSITKARSTPRPRNRARARTQASGTPTTSDRAVAAVAQKSDSRSASRTSLFWRIPRSPDHGARISIAASGTSRNSAPARWVGAGSRTGEPARLEDGHPLRREDVVDEGLSSGRVRRLGQRGDRVGRRRVDVGRDLDALDLVPRRLHVGDVDDAGVDLAEGDLGQHGLDVGLLAHRGDGDLGVGEHLRRDATARHLRLADSH